MRQMSSDNDSWFTKNGNDAPQDGSQFPFPIGFRKVPATPANITGNSVSNQLFLKLKAFFR